MLIPFPSKRTSSPLTYKVLTPSFINLGIHPGDELTVAEAPIKNGDLVVIEHAGKKKLRRYDTWCRKLSVIGRVMTITRYLAMPSTSAGIVYALVQW